MEIFMRENVKTVYAGFILRFFAYIIDIVIIAAVQGSVLVAFFRALSLPMSPLNWSLFGVKSLAVFLLYFILMTKLTDGQTLGKMIFGLKVISLNGEKLTWTTVIIREGFLRFVFQVGFLGIGYVVTAFTPKKQGISDLFCDTLVVKEGAHNLYRLYVEAVRNAENLKNEMKVEKSKADTNAESISNIEEQKRVDEFKKINSTNSMSSNFKPSTLTSPLASAKDEEWSKGVIKGNYIDLHMHSIFSNDGEFSVVQLMEKCQQAGVKVMSITDHNSAKANHEAKKIAKDYDISYITGIEMDCTYKGLVLHLLGYGIDENSPDFERHEEKIWEDERVASLKRLELTRQLGFELSKEELNAVSNLEQGGMWTGEVFAEVLLGKPEYIHHELLLPYREGGSKGDNPMANFYWDFYALGKPCYAPIEFPTFEEALDLIQRNGGKAVLAHPEKILKGRYELIEEMASLGLDGLEVFSSYHNAETAKLFYEKANRLGLVVTCGSDYHGKTKPSVSLLGHGCWIKSSTMEAVLKLRGLLG